MEAYVYQAALLCGPCGERVRALLAKTAPADAREESTYDSDEYPKGPYPDGGGESDTPDYCDRCRCFLENPLTDEGYRYVNQVIAENPDSECAKEWAAFYPEREDYR